MTFHFPFVSRARYDDALARIAELERERKHLLNVAANMYIYPEVEQIERPTWGHPAEEPKEEREEFKTESELEEATRIVGRNPRRITQYQTRKNYARFAEKFPEEPRNAMEAIVAEGRKAAATL